MIGDLIKKMTVLSFMLFFYSCSSDDAKYDLVEKEISNLFKFKKVEFAEGISINEKQEEYSYIEVSLSESLSTGKSNSNLNDISSSVALIIRETFYEKIYAKSKIIVNINNINIDGKVADYSASFPVEDINNVLKCMIVVDSIFSTINKTNYAATYSYLDDSIKQKESQVLFENTLIKADSVDGVSSRYKIMGFETFIDKNKNKIFRIKLVVFRESKVKGDIYFLCSNNDLKVLKILF